MIGLLPIIIVASWAALILVLDAFSGKQRRSWSAGIGVFGAALGIAAACSAWRATPARTMLFDAMFVVDRFALACDVIFLIGAALTLLLLAANREEHTPGEAPALILLAVSGMMLLSHAGDLVTIFLGIETMSLPVYVLAGMDRSARGTESALKYFLLGAFATGFLVYGIVLIYGAAATTSLERISSLSADLGRNGMFVAGVLLLLVAFGFKIAAVPFHMWAPDVYEGAPTPITAFMAAAVKAGGFAALLRVLPGILSGAPATNQLLHGYGMTDVLAFVAAATMIVGNVAAIRQENVKRMLAYSSVAHAGYLLIGIIAAGVVGEAGRTAVLFYLAAYTFMTIGSFGVCASAGATTLAEFAGLGQRRPALALAMTFFLASLGGVPPTAGFFGKLLLFQSALASPALLWLVLVAVSTSVISMYYYLRVVVAMYLREPVAAAASSIPAPVSVALALALAGVLHLGLFPGGLLAALASLGS